MSDMLWPLSGKSFFACDSHGNAGIYFGVLCTIVFHVLKSDHCWIAVFFILCIAVIIFRAYSGSFKKILLSFECFAFET